MAIRKIHEVGDPCLAKVCRPVTEFNDRLHELLDDMAETLEEAGGVGLAAPQVGILRRVRHRHAPNDRARARTGPLRRDLRGRR